MPIAPAAHRVRVREGGEVLATVPFDRGAFSCVLDDGPDPRITTRRSSATSNGRPDRHRRPVPGAPPSRVTKAAG
ncbi:hypothetical protein HBB16_16170 [Pseudonocardia sp. MCCB 268]|nr:hypothetical protein [Pseudonocardia cytotoxica]